MKTSHQPSHVLPSSSLRSNRIFVSRLQHTSLCTNGFKTIALTLWKAKESRGCTAEECAHCTKRRKEGKLTAGWGGKSSLAEWSKHLRSLTGAVVKFHTGNRKSDNAKTVIARFLNRGHVDDVVGNVDADEVFPVRLFPCVTVRRTLILILQAWGSLYEIVDELDPRVYRREGWKAGLWMVGLLNLSILAYGPAEPSPTLRSNAWHYMSFSGRYQLWCHVPSLRSNKLVENMHRTLNAEGRAGRARRETGGSIEGR